MIRPIIQAPDTRLNMVAQAVTKESEKWAKDIVQDLIDTFAITPHCIGLSATQLGHSWRVIIIDTSSRRTETRVMMNPRFLRVSEDLQLVRDGCMSVEHGMRFANTKRPKRITVEWDDPETWEVKRQKFTGLLAAAIHHEMDHLDGVLFTDRIIAAMGSKR